MKPQIKQKVGVAVIVTLEWMLQNGLMDPLMNLVQCRSLPYLGMLAIGIEKFFHNSESQLLWIKSCALYTSCWVPVSGVLFGSEFGSHGYDHSKVFSTFEKKK